MNPDSNPADLPEHHNPLQAMQEGEQVLCTIKRHPIGIFAIYFAIGFFLFLGAIIIFAVIPALMPNADKAQINYYGLLALLVASLAGVGYAFISHIVYWGNRWIVTSDSITQVQQRGLFVKHSGQLSLESLEDITSEKNGLLMQMFNYGVLKAETAGERSKFMFLYCPKPEEYARLILNARESFMLSHKEKQEVGHTQAAQQPLPPATP